MSLLNSFQAHSDKISRIKQINQIKQSPFNTKYVATCSTDKTVKIWNVSTSFNWTLITTYSQHSSYVNALEWLDSDTLASAGKTIKLWSMTTGQTKRTIKTNQYVFSLKLLNNYIHLAAGLGNGVIKTYNINSGNLVSSLKGHTDAVLDLVQLRTDLLASSGSRDKTIRIWNLTTKTCKIILAGHASLVLKQINSSLLASGSNDQTIKLWDIKSGQLIRTLTGHEGYYGSGMSVDLLNSQTLVSCAGDGAIKLWNWSTGECFSTIYTTGSGIFALAVIKF